MIAITLSLCFALSGLLPQSESFSQATTAYKKKDYKAADAAFSKIIESKEKLNPLHSTALYWRAQCRTQLKKTTEAQADLVALLRNGPKPGLSALAAADYKILTGKAWALPKKVPARQNRIQRRQEAIQKAMERLLEQNADPQIIQAFQAQMAQMEMQLPRNIEQAAAEPIGTLSDAERKQIPPLIDQLAARSFKERKQAYDKLKAMGKPITPFLEKAKDHKDPEIAIQARQLLSEL